MVSVPVTGKCVQDMGRKDQWSCWDLWAILLAPLQIDQIALEKLNRKAISELFANNSPEKLSLKGCYLSLFRKEPTDCLYLSWKSGSQMIENVLKEPKKTLGSKHFKNYFIEGLFSWTSYWLFLRTEPNIFLNPELCFSGCFINRLPLFIRDVCLTCRKRIVTV